MKRSVILTVGIILLLQIPCFAYEYTNMLGKESSSTMPVSGIAFKKPDASKRKTIENSTVRYEDGTIVKTQTISFYGPDGKVTKSIINTTVTNPDGSIRLTSKETINYTYATMNGQSYLMQKVSNSQTSFSDGSSETITRRTIYLRDSKGVCIGVSQNATGTRTMIDPNTGAIEHYLLTDYQAQFKYFPEYNDWLIVSESMTWNLI